MLSIQNKQNIGATPFNASISQANTTVTDIIAYYYNGAPEHKGSTTSNASQAPKPALEQRVTLLLMEYSP